MKYYRNETGYLQGFYVVILDRFVKRSEHFLKANCYKETTREQMEKFKIIGSLEKVEKNAEKHGLTMGMYEVE